MLQKLRVPAGRHLLSFPPVENKFGNKLLGKLRIDIGHLQHLKDFLAGLVILGQELRCCVVFQGHFELGPLPAHMSDELGIPGASFQTGLTPVKHEFRDGILDKGVIDAGMLKNA